MNPVRILDFRCESCRNFYGVTVHCTGKCKARFSYSGKPPPENGRSVINFEVNDVVELLNCDDPNWWEVGECTASATITIRIR